MNELTEDSVRADVRAWLEANCPPEMRQPMATEDDVCWGGRGVKFKNEAQKLWLERMGAKGWTVPEWPSQYGGGGLSRGQDVPRLPQDARRGEVDRSRDRLDAGSRALSRGDACDRAGPG